VLPDGSIVLGGSWHGKGRRDLALIRFSSRGLRSRGFGKQGAVIEQTRGAGHILGWGGMSERKGQITLAGYAAFSGRSEIVLARFNAEGKAVRSFGAGGTERTTLGRDQAGLESDAILADSAGGAVLGANVSEATGPSESILARLDSAGSMAPSFGTNGSPTSLNRRLGPILEQRDGGLLVVADPPYGSSSIGPGGGCLGTSQVARFDASGALDPAFGVDGFASVPGLGCEGQQALAIDTAGRIVIAGEGVGNSRALRVVRLLPDGSPDATFGQNGELRVRGMTEAPGTNWMAVHDDNAILLGGVPTSPRGPSLIQLSSTGRREAAFG